MRCGALLLAEATTPTEKLEDGSDDGRIEMLLEVKWPQVRLLLKALLDAEAGAEAPLDKPAGAATYASAVEDTGAIADAAGRALANLDRARAVLDAVDQWPASRSTRRPLDPPRAYVARNEALDHVPVRARPSTKADKVDRLPIGATVTAHAALGAWLLVSRDEERWVLSTHPLLGALLVDADA